MNQIKPVKDMEADYIIARAMFFAQSNLSMRKEVASERAPSQRHYFAAAFVMATNSSIFRLAPPTSAPSISG